MDKDYLNYSAPSLPSNFAEEVLEYELKLETDQSICDIQKLVDLYSAAIEHYSAKQDLRYLNYQKRLNKLLSRKDVNTCIEESKKDIWEQQTETTRLEAFYESQKRMQSHTDTSANLSFLVNENLKEQEDSLENRVKLRKSFRESSKAKQLQKINQYYEEVKSQKIQELKSLFEAQLQEFKGFEHQEMAQGLIQEVQKQMNLEIEEVSTEINKQRDQAIEDFKSK